MAQINGLPPWFTRAGTQKCTAGGSGGGPGFIDKNLAAAARFVARTLGQEEYAARDGLYQKIDARARLIGTLALVLACALTSSAWVVAALLALSAVNTVLSKVPLAELAKRVAPPVVFTSVLVIPVFFSVITPGSVVFTVYSGRFELAVTAEGVRTGAFFIARVATMVSLVSLFFISTRQVDFFRALSHLPVPGFFVTALFMTFKYVFILLRIVEDSALARKSRTINYSALTDSREWIASRMALILKRSLKTADEVGMAMASRGFTGTLRTFGTKPVSGYGLLWIGFCSFVFFLTLGF